MSMEDEESDECCAVCGETLCDWNEFGDELMDRADKNLMMTAGTVSNKKKGKVMYQTFIHMKYGHLGCSVQIPIVKCVLVDEVQEMFPVENEDEYMGYQSN